MPTLLVLADCKTVTIPGTDAAEICT